MTKADIIDRVAHGTGLTKIETEAVVNGMLSTLASALLDGEGVDLRGFGTFRVVRRAARTAMNPKTREKVEVGPRYVPVFRPSRDLRAAVDAAEKARRRQRKRSRGDS